MAENDPNNDRVLILAPLGCDGPVMAERLREAGFDTEVCADAHALARRFTVGAGALLLTEEALEQAGIPGLFEQLHGQPAWSELPLIVLTRASESMLPRLLELVARAAGAITLLERPIGAATLLRTIEVALRSRRRQYQVRDLLEQERRQNADLQAARSAALNLADDATRARDQAKKAEEALLEINCELDRRVEERTAQLRMLTSRLTDAQDEERRRIAAGLHDSVCQLLAACQIKVGQAETCQEEGARKALLAAADSILNEVSDEVRELIFEISSPSLFDAGFVVAVKNLCDQMAIRDGVNVDLKCGDGELEVPRSLRPGLYYNLRELLANVARHADTNEASVRIETTNVTSSYGLNTKSRLLRIVVCDNGCGFDTEHFKWEVTRAGGFGLMHLRERMRELGGRLHLESEPGKGVEVVMELVIDS